MVTLEEMLANPVVREQVSRMLDAPRGIIALNGDAGSGKSAGMYALVEELRKRGTPSTLLLNDAYMRQYLLEQSAFADWDIRMIEGTERGWSDAIGAAPADRPIVVEEFYNHSADAIVAAARKGATIFTTIGTPYVGIDAAHTLLKNGVSNQDFLDLFSCIATQMLLPRLCPHCRVEVTLHGEDARLADPDGIGPVTVWQEQGCAQCDGKGVKNRMALHEVLFINEASRPVLANYLEHGDLRNPLPAGHVTIQQTAREMLRQGAIGLGTFKTQITQNPILRMQHQWEQERRHSGRVRDMFSRFVTSQVVDRMLAGSDMQAVMGGERRRVTCMFADIRGFTPLAESMPAHDLFLLLNRYFKEIIRAVTEHGGTIDKFVGDCVMVIFGAPVDQADHEFMAVRCAQEVQRCVGELNRERAPDVPLHMGIGINTGEAVTGCLGSEQRMDYTALGDTVNTAARLEAGAAPGQIVIGPATAQAVAGRIACRSLGHLKLKGKAEEIEAFEVGRDA